MKQTEQNAPFGANGADFQVYVCHFCDYTTSKKDHYARHETTMKHKRALLKQKSTMDNHTVSDVEFVCECCGMTLKSRTTFWRHRKKCVAGQGLDTHDTSCVNVSVKSVKQNVVIGRGAVEAVGAVGAVGAVEVTVDAEGHASVETETETALASSAGSVKKLSSTATTTTAMTAMTAFNRSGGWKPARTGLTSSTMCDDDSSESDDSDDSDDGDNSHTDDNTTLTKRHTSLESIMAVEAEMALFTAKNHKPATPDAVLEGQIEVINKFSDMMDMFLTLIKRQDKLIEQNAVIQNKVIEQQEQLIKIAQRPTTQNNIINNFNMLNYLNEEHKDALTIQDFINSIDVTMDDMYYTRDNGYVKGMCNVLVKKIENIPDEYRPIHCTDKKRLKFLVKTKEAWKRDDDNKNIENVMSDITQKHILCLSEWKKLNPDWMEHEDLRDEYVKISMQIMDGQRENGEKKKKAIVKTIGTTTHIGGKIEKARLNNSTEAGDSDPTDMDGAEDDDDTIV